MSDLRNVTRRAFHIHSGATMLGGALIVPVTDGLLDASATGLPQGRATPACDFQASFMTWDVRYRDDPRPYARHNIPHGKWTRIQIDAIIDVIQAATGDSERFVLIAPCRTEWVYAEDHLFQLPGAEYRNIYSLTQERWMGRGLTHTGGQSNGHPARPRYWSLAIDVRLFHKTMVLTTAAAIVQATSANTPLVGRTTIDAPGGSARCILEYPIRTMNFQPKTDSFQVDTGPLLVPDFASTEQQAIDRLEMAHIAYNRLDRAEFILRRPTTVRDDNDNSSCKILHYSEVREHLCRECDSFRTMMSQQTGTFRCILCGTSQPRTVGGQTDCYRAD